MKPHHIRKIKSVPEFLISESESVQLDSKAESCFAAADDTLLALVAVLRCTSENASLFRCRLIQQQALD